MKLTSRCRAILLGATMMAGPAWAQTAPAADAADTSAPTVATPANPDQTTASQPGSEQDTVAGSDDAIVITGYRQSYANAIASKRNQIGITDGISSDGLGRFPDLNVGEALQRVPGVQINREAEGRNATINLRGLPGEYARLTLNGVAFAEPILNEAAPLGAFNSDIFSGIVVDKSPLANAQSGGLSGNVDLQIAPALGRKDGGSIKLAYEYNQLGDKKSPAGTVSYNHHFSDDFAVFGVLAYKRENFRRDSLLFNSYLNVTPTQAQANAATLGAYLPASAACPSCTGSTTRGGVIYNSALRQYTRLNKGDLYSAAAGAEYRMSDEAKIGVTGFYTDRNLPKTRQYLNIVSQGISSVLRPLSTPVLLDDSRYVLNDFDYANADVTSSTRDFAQHQKAWGLNANGEWKNEGWRVNVIGTASKASNRSQEIATDFETLPTAAGNRINGTFHSGAGKLSDFSITLEPRPAIGITGIPNGYFAGLNLPQAHFDTPTQATATNRFNFQGSESNARNDLYAGQFDVERSLEGILTGVQVGARYEHNKFISSGLRINSFGLPVQNITDAVLFDNPLANDFFDGRGGRPTTNWRSIDIDILRAALRPVQVFPGAELSSSGYNINYAENSYQLYNFSNQNNLMIGYGQVKYEFVVAGVTIRGNAGVRYEHTKNTIQTLNRVTLSNPIGSPGDFRTITSTNSYDKWLPSFIAVADLTEKLVARAAAYRTYVRPQPRQFYPTTVVGQPNNGIYSLTLGNSDLQPYNSTSLDASVEWYNRPNSLMSLAVFQKRITGLIAVISDPRQLCPSDGSPYGLGTLTVNGDRCESSLTYTAGGVTQPFLVAASGFQNQSNPITVRGLEANIQQSFDFLPGFLRNLGGGANYAYTTISGRTTAGAPATLPGVSKHNVNVIGYYESPLFGIRAVYNLRSKYDLASAGSFTGAARQVRARGQLDMSGTLNVTPALSLSIDAFNLTNAVRYEYENQPNLPRRFDYDGRTFTATLRAQF